MKYLIAGLGNIGDEYDNTRHNIGFEVLDSLVSQKEDTKFKTDKLGSVATYKTRGRTLILLKPSTYMNLSGKAVRYWLEKEKIKIENLLIVTDDIALPFGKVKLKTRGSDGGHNGHKSVAQLLQSTKYARLKFGVGNDFPRGKQSDYVLSSFSAEEKKQLSELIKKAEDFIISFCTIGPQFTMNKLN